MDKKNTLFEHPHKQELPILIVAIGGSAGGLEAFELILQNLPHDIGLGYVILSHFDPHHKMLMPEILQRSTRMRVMQAEDGQKILPNVVYILPPNKEMSILNGIIQLLDRELESHEAHMPIDFFFRHLAADQHEKSVAIIVSGMGTDGTLGIRAIKENYGITIAQNPDNAKYRSMPSSAIDSGYIDHVLDVEKIPSFLVKFSQHKQSGVGLTSSDEVTLDNSIQKIMILLRSATGHDFSLYKETTILRRIERRLLLHQLLSIKDYITYLQENPSENELLFKDLLIGVTNFFRDGFVFEDLKEIIKSNLLPNLHPREPIRVWVPGCSTGEEAYSIAIVLYESLHEAKLYGKHNVQIFATDLNEEAINRGRLGIYPENIIADITKERLNKFFTKEGTQYIVKKQIRELIIFAPQNVISEPPFTKLNLLCCRNLLIYLNQDLQKKLIALFHYSLKDKGILMLGTSESLNDQNEIFQTLNQKSKLFYKKRNRKSSNNIMDLPSSILSSTLRPKMLESNEVILQRSLNHYLIDTFAPPTIIVDKKGKILFISGKTGEYLEPSPGKAEMNLLNMVRDGLKNEINYSLYRVFNKDQKIHLSNLKVNESKIIVDVTIQRFNKLDFPEPLAIVFFQKVVLETPINDELSTENLPPKKLSIEYNELKKELKHTKEHLQSTIEEMQTSQEELKSSNEELQATNEELQSTNEELKTSKEELKSLNEELVTVNSELHNKIDSLSAINDDMKNIINSIDTAIIFVDNDLCIKSFTSQATKIVNLMPSDIGRPIKHFSIALKYDNFIQDIQDVLDTLIYKEIDVETEQKRYYSMRIMPYRTSNNVIDGVVIRFNDITEIKMVNNTKFFYDRIETEARELMGEINIPICCLDKNQKITYINEAFLTTFALDKSDIIQKALPSIGFDLFEPKGLQDLEIALNQKSRIEFLFESSQHHQKFLVKILKKARKYDSSCVYQILFWDDEKKQSLEE